MADKNKQTKPLISNFHFPFDSIINLNVSFATSYDSGVFFKAKFHDSLFLNKTKLINNLKIPFLKQCAQQYL